MLSSCVHEIPSGSHVSHATSADGVVTTLVEMPNGDIRKIPACNTTKIVSEDGSTSVQNLPMLVSTAETRMSKKSDVGGLPPDYNGWLQYTALNVSRAGLTGGFDSFTNVMSVPDVPKSRPQVLYFFPGLQNIDWIPKVDPEPTSSNPFDIIQPVLQYPGGLFSSGWALKSWYVTVNAGALYSTAINNIKAGDEILCNMTRLDDDSWVISGALKSDPSKITTQKASNERLKLQPWAYNTLECYGCDGCDTFPTKPITFTDNKLYQAGKLVTTGDKWVSNPKPATDKQCNEATKIASNGDTTIGFV
jgi:hypothetical protein